MFKKFQIKNGLNVLLIESHKSPVLSIQMWVRTGSADEGKKEEGISHFIEHLVFKGSRKFGVGEIAAAVEGAGGELNAYTSFDQTVFYVTISKEFQNVGFEAISEMMGFPKFDETEIDNEREVVIEEIKRSHDSPHRQASRLLFSSFYKKHPYGIPVIGYEDNIRKVSRKILLRYYQGRYNPKNMTLVVAGDFEEKKMRQTVQQFFSDLPKHPVRSIKRKKEAKKSKAQVVVEKASFEETIVHFAFPAPQASHKDMPALEVLALILGQGDSSRLNQRLRMDQHIVNYAGSSVFSARDPGFLAISMSLNFQELDGALAGLVEEIEKIVSEPPQLAELKKAVTNLASEQFYQLESVDGLARGYGHFEDLYRDPSHFEKFIRQVQNLTAADIHKVAKKYFVKSAPIFILMSNQESAPLQKKLTLWLKDFAKKIDKASRSKSSLKNLKSAKKTAKVNFALKAVSGKSSLEIHTLPGCTLITRPSFETPVMSLRLASLGGSRLETHNKRGTTELLSRVWTAGAGEISESELNRKIEEMAGSLSAFGGRNSQGLSMTCLRTFSEPMLDLFFSTLNEPLFENSAIEREQKSMLEHLKLRRDNPSQLCVLEFMKAMFGSHPYGQDPLGDETTIQGLNVSDLREMIKYRANLTLVASGAFDVEHLVKHTKKALAAQASPPVKTKAVEFAKQSQEKFVQIQKQQSHIILGFPGLTVKDPDRFSLQVMQAILAGQGGRLFVELRDKASLAYSVAPMRMEGPDGGYFGAYIGCSPEKAQTAIRMMKEEFGKLTEYLVPESELKRAERYLIGKHDIELQKNSNITSSVLFDHLYGIDYQETYHYADRIRSVTAASVKKMAERIFRQHSVTVVVGPQPA